MVDTAKLAGDWRIALPICAAFTAGLALLFFWAWHPARDFYAFNMPLAPPFAAFFLDRWAAQQRRAWRVDAAVLALALCRVFIPPFPFVSGHALFAGYAFMTAEGRVLRVTAALALLLTIWFKLATWGDWKTPLGALVMAAAAALVRKRVATTSRTTPAPAPWPPPDN